MARNRGPRKKKKKKLHYKPANHGSKPTLGKRPRMARYKDLIELMRS